MKNKTSEKQLLVIFLANDNHLSNVNTLQSIYKQDYPNIYLVVCNDCTAQFQSERLLYNFEVGRPENIRRILLHENECPIGEFQSQKQFWNCIDADYVVTLHSGEFFTKPHALSECIEYLECDSSIDAVITMAELWSDDMKKHLSTLSVLKEHQDILSEEPHLDLRNLKDCMFLCRLRVLRNLVIYADQGKKPVSQVVCSIMLEQGMNVMALPVPLCKFSQSSIRDVDVSVPDTYGNTLLQSISELVHSYHEKALEMATTTNLSEAHSTKKRYRHIILKLIKYSRISKLKYYALIDSIVIICTLLLILSESAYRVIATKIMIALAVILLVWSVGMLLCNLYFKKNPQRMVF